MVHFIALEDARKKLLANTVALLNLIEERRELARAIASMKNENGLSLRDSTREAKVRASVGSHNPILNMLFEFTLIEEKGGLRIDRPLQFSADHETSLFLIGMFLCRPGLEIHSRSVPESFEIGCSASGGHIVMDDGPCDSTISMREGRAIKIDGTSVTIFPEAFDLRNRSGSMRLIF